MSCRPDRQDRLILLVATITTCFRRATTLVAEAIWTKVPRILVSCIF